MRQGWGWLVLALCGFGCESDDSQVDHGDGGGAEHSQDTDASTEDPDTTKLDDTDSTAPSCVPTGEAVQVVPSTDSWTFSISEGYLYFVDHDMGTQDPLLSVSKSGAIRKVSRDGSGDTTLYTAPPDERVVSVFADGADLYFSKRIPLSSLSNRTFLYRISKDGGEPVRLSASAKGFSSDGATIFGADDAFLYVKDLTRPGRAVRVSKADGAETTIVSVDSTAWNAETLYKDQIWFTPGQGTDGIYVVPKDGTAVKPTIFSSNNCQSTLTITEQGTYCGVIRVNEQGKVDRLETLFGDDIPYSMSQAFGNDVFLYSGGSRPRLDRVNLEAKELVTLVCDRQDVLHVSATDDEVFWLEERDDVRMIFRTERR